MSNAFPPRGSTQEVEAGFTLMPKFDSDGLIPCITIHAESGEVAMFAWMNAESLRLTIETGKVHYYSRSRKKLWLKGEESGHFQLVTEIRTDCDQDVILVRARILGGAACHTGYESCFFRKLADAETLRLEPVYAARAFDPAAVYGRKS
jgi:phosphoribosyl-AMP cyclohydrolase